MSHNHPHKMLPISVSFQGILLSPLSNNSQTATFLMPTFTSKLQVFFKVECHIYYSMYEVFNHLTCKNTLLFLLGSYLLLCVTDKCWVLPQSHFLHKTYDGMFIAWFGMAVMILRNAYFAMQQNWLDLVRVWVMQVNSMVKSNQTAYLQSVHFLIGKWYLNKWIKTL